MFRRRGSRLFWEKQKATRVIIPSVTNGALKCTTAVMRLTPTAQTDKRTKEAMILKLLIIIQLTVFPSPLGRDNKK
ncbi:MAG: hypothetical protein D3925_15620 [Candidatus Electrothrix sp. AR5]|nr:hypothetical protein [Candidatus Electrothrix sp. AR5]